MQQIELEWKASESVNSSLNCANRSFFHVELISILANESIEEVVGFIGRRWDRSNQAQGQD